MARQARCNRVHSAVTHQMNAIEAGKASVYAALLKLSSGQLPFLGLYILSGLPAPVPLSVSLFVYFRVTLRRCRRC